MWLLKVNLIVYAVRVDQWWQWSTALCSSQLGVQNILKLNLALSLCPSKVYLSSLGPAHCLPRQRKPGMISGSFLKSIACTCAIVGLPSAKRPEGQATPLVLSTLPSEAAPRATKRNVPKILAWALTGDARPRFFEALLEERGEAITVGCSNLPDVAPGLPRPRKVYWSRRCSDQSPSRAATEWLKIKLRNSRARSVRKHI